MSASQKFKTTFKQILACIFLSVSQFKKYISLLKDTLYHLNEWGFKEIDVFCAPHYANSQNIAISMKSNILLDAIKLILEPPS